MEEQRKVIITGSIIIIFVALVIVVYYFFFREKAKEALPVQEVVEEQPVQFPEEKPGLGEEVPEPIDIELDKSDEFVREQAPILSSHPMLTTWLGSKELIRKFVAAVDSIANGLSPRPQIDFFSPKGEFRVKRRGYQYYANPSGYKRYDPVADVLASMDSQECVKLYRQLKPAIQDAYRELGYPDEDFDFVLREALVELLRVPVIEGELRLKREIISFAIADPRLENLSQAQKHLLRMGPENVQKIQNKLREIAEMLGIPSNQLPRQRTYSPT